MPDLFHCSYNDFFETTWHSDRDIVTSANWKQLAGFAKYGGTEIEIDGVEYIIHCERELRAVVA